MQIRICGGMQMLKQSSLRWLMVTVFVVGVLSSFLAAPALADSIGFDITVPNLALQPFPSPYAHVDINRTSSTAATITFTGLSTGGFTYLFGAANAIDVNVNATTFTVGIPVGGSLSSPPGSGNVSQFGVFNVSFDNSDGFSDRFSTTNFTLTDTSGTWPSASDVLIANAEGSRAAAHIFATASDCEGACVTGFAGDGLRAVPEPSTLLLFGSSLIGLGFAGRRSIFRGRAHRPEASSAS